MLKPAQTGVAAGEPGDLADVVRLAAPATVCELARYPDPLAPATAARRAGGRPWTPTAAVAAARLLARSHDLVLVEGAGGLLVRFTDERRTPSPTSPRRSTRRCSSSRRPGSARSTPPR